MAKKDPAVVTDAERMEHAMFRSLLEQVVSHGLAHCIVGVMSRADDAPVMASSKDGVERVATVGLVIGSTVISPGREYQLKGIADNLSALADDCRRRYAAFVAKHPAYEEVVTTAERHDFLEPGEPS